MFMRRTAAALRRQDWTAVAIEFVMVVLGVLLAFQISEWASGRNEERIRKESVERLLREAEQDVAALEDIVGPQTQWLIPNMIVTAKNLRNPSPDPETKQAMIAGIGGSAALPKPLAPDSFYRELISSGRFGEIGDVKMRDAVSNYASSMQYALQGIDYARMSLSQPFDTDAIHRVYDEKNERSRRIEVDFRLLATDRRAQDQFLTRLGNQQFAVGNLKETLLAARQMCAEVARVAGRPCRPRPMESKVGDR